MNEYDALIDWYAIAIRHFTHLTFYVVKNVMLAVKDGAVISHCDPPVAVCIVWAC